MVQLCLGAPSSSELLRLGTADPFGNAKLLANFMHYSRACHSKIERLYYYLFIWFIFWNIKQRCLAGTFNTIRAICFKHILYTLSMLANAQSEKREARGAVSFDRMYRDLRWDASSLLFILRESASWVLKILVVKRKRRLVGVTA